MYSSSKIRQSGTASQLTLQKTRRHQFLRGTEVNNLHQSSRRCLWNTRRIIGHPTTRELRNCYIQKPLRIASATSPHLPSMGCAERDPWARDALGLIFHPLPPPHPSPKILRISSLNSEPTMHGSLVERFCSKAPNWVPGVDLKQDHPCIGLWELDGHPLLYDVNPVPPTCWFLGLCSAGGFISIAIPSRYISFRFSLCYEGA